MANARGMVRVAAAMATALALVVGSAFADELFGVITKVDSDARKITVVAKKTDKESELTVADDALLVTPKNEDGAKVDLRKLEDRIAKAKEKNAEFKGIPARITHEGGKVSKIQIVAKKKAAASN